MHRFSPFFKKIKLYYSLNNRNNRLLWPVLYFYQKKFGLLNFIEKTLENARYIEL
jgi:hypothetical protein